MSDLLNKVRIAGQQARIDHYFRFRSSVSHDDEFLLMIGLLRSISLLLSSRSIEIYKLLYVVSVCTDISISEASTYVEKCKYF